MKSRGRSGRSGKARDSRGLGARLELAHDPGPSRARGPGHRRTRPGRPHRDRRAGQVSGPPGSGDPGGRTAAPLAGRNVSAAPVRDAIVAGLNDTSAPVASRPSKRPARSGFEAVPGLSGLAEDDLTRLAAIRALAALAEPGAAGVYLSAIEDRDPDVRQAGERGLATIRDAAALELASCWCSGRLSSNAAAILERALERFTPLGDWQTIGLSRAPPRDCSPRHQRSTSRGRSRAQAGGRSAGALEPLTGPRDAWR